MVPIPKQYKAITPYLALSNEHLDRDTCVHYWALYYFVQKAIEIDKTSPECTSLLAEKLNYLEQLKSQFKTAPQMSDELEAQLHLEQYSEKLFSYADGQDRAKVFNKNVIKSFYTAAHLLDVLTLFGELSEKLTAMRKYARWKSVYLSNCMSKGETPLFGPCETDDDLKTLSDEAHRTRPRSSLNIVEENVAEEMSKLPNNCVASGVSVERNEMINTAQRFCKYAISALEYEDVNTAVENLISALKMLKPSAV